VLRPDEETRRCASRAELRDRLGGSKCGVDVKRKWKRSGACFKVA